MEGKLVIHMELRVCKKCHRIFESTTAAIVCPYCSRELEAVFKIVKSYIRSHPEASIVEVSEACNTDMEQIKQWIREERIEYTKESVIGIECERCGKIIKTGRLCAECKGELLKNIQSLYVKKEFSQPARANGKMYFIKNIEVIM